MNGFIEGPFGVVHTLAAIIALIVGAMVLANKKGTALHRQLGYTYFFSMLLLNISAIPITNMTGSIGLFHLFVVISLPTILAALYFPLFGRHKQNWLLRHFEFMYWSYIGLLAAFVAEVMVRLPLMLTIESSEISPNEGANMGFALAMAVMFIVMSIGEYVFRQYKKRLFS